MIEEPRRQKIGPFASSWVWPAQGEWRFSALLAKGRRPAQEDYVIPGARIELSDVAQGSGWLFAVLDGHGGGAAAEWACQHTPRLFTEALQAASSNPGIALRNTVQQLVLGTKQMEAGSTALIAYVVEGNPTQCWLANLGDCRAAWLGADGEPHQTVDHNVVTHSQDRQEVIRRGGGQITFDGVYLILEPTGIGLNPSRTIGDAPWEDLLIRTPDLYRVALPSGAPLILASDGFWNALELPLKDLVKRATQTTAHSLAEELSGRLGGSGDNVSLIIYRR